MVIPRQASCRQQPNNMSTEARRSQTVLRCSISLLVAVVVVAEELCKTLTIRGVSEMTRKSRQEFHRTPQRRQGPWIVIKQRSKSPRNIALLAPNNCPFPSSVSCFGYSAAFSWRLVPRVLPGPLPWRPFPISLTTTTITIPNRLDRAV